MKIIEYIKDVINPQGIKCVVCGRDVEKKEYGICSRCKKELPRNSHICKKCGVDIKSMNDYCDSCGRNNLHFDEARSVCRYEKEAQSIVYRLKFGGQKYISRPIAKMMTETLSKQGWEYDVITYIPSSKETIKKRGYNQAKLIAEEICDIIQKPLQELLEKGKEAAPQEEKTYKERFENMRGAFKVTGEVPKSVLLIDDVKTTGATLSEASRVLKNSGCEKVYCLTFAARVKQPILAHL